MRPLHIEHMASGQNTLDMAYIEVLINYNINMPIEANTWNSEAYSISIFRHMEFLEIDVKNIFTSLLCMADFIKTRKVQQDKILNVAKIQEFGKAA